MQLALALSWCCMLSVSVLSSFPGKGPGIREHPEGFMGVVRDRTEHIWDLLKSKYFWFVGDHAEVYDTMDWTLELTFLEKIDDVQGLNHQTREELRQKCLTRVGELLVLVIMASLCLTVIRLTLKEKFQTQNRKSKSH